MERGQTTSVSTPHLDMPYDCRPWGQYPFVDGIIASIDFPSCWNGTGLRPEDVTYPEGGACPPGFGNIIPKLSERVHYGVMNPLGLDGTLAFQLSSGPAYSMHADFWNTWEQERLDQLVGTASSRWSTAAPSTHELDPGVRSSGLSVRPRERRRAGR